jgi:hypothetical protein
MNLFFVSSPFQLICAMEALAYYKCKSNLLVIRDQENDLAEKHVSKIICKDDWDFIIKLPKKPKKFSLPRMPDLLNKIKKIKPDMTFDKVFFAEYSTWRIAVILANVHADREIMFDDGTLTLFEFENKIKNKKVVNVSRPKKELSLRLLGYKRSRLIKPHANFEMFTFFNISSPDTTISQNFFTRLISTYNLGNVFSSDGNIIFIGDGGTKRMLNLDKYKESLVQLCATNSNKKVYYFPHRNEPNTVRKLISEVKGLEYVNSLLPIEMQIQQVSEGVSAIYGFYSSALYSLSTIYTNIPLYTRKLENSELNIEAQNSYLLSESILFVDKYLKGDNVHSWHRL